jgi:23S rRNA (pseudouridine1915-N3)-methyltransferase
LIKIIAVGKIKEKYFRDAIGEYTKRLSKYTKLDIIEIQDSNINSEKDLILKNIKDKDYVITLEIEGTTYSSLNFSKKIDNQLIQNSNICFIIGGSDGLHEEVKKIAKEKISFSNMTFPHQLFRIILLEQVYRAYKIINNESYHK